MLYVCVWYLSSYSDDSPFDSDPPPSMAHSDSAVLAEFAERLLRTERMEESSSSSSTTDWEEEHITLVHPRIPHLFHGDSLPDYRFDAIRKALRPTAHAARFIRPLAQPAPGFVNMIAEQVHPRRPNSPTRFTIIVVPNGVTVGEALQGILRNSDSVLILRISTLDGDLPPLTNQQLLSRTLVQFCRYDARTTEAQVLTFPRLHSDLSSFT